MLHTSDGQRISVQIVEASPDSVTLANVDNGANLDYVHQFTLSTPVENGTLSRA